ncbi:MAG: phosphoenolpyruvate-utilizing N-terminal domain-containing protein, partial [Kiritimatiellales bacterium]|nr:phosphoenolpyruvate-utilizing N-terminal domain-containing protein [Kiritimatiellales bacterium]
MHQNVLTGKPASDGVAMGAALVTFAPIPREEEDSASTYALADFQRAVKETRDQLSQFQQSMQERMAEAASRIFAVHLAILEDAQFVGRIQEEIEAGVPVQKAIHAVTDACIDVLSRVEMS